MGVTKFTELAAWRRADELRQLVLRITARPLVAKDFRFCDQCKDAARSAASNIAEGFGRYHHKEFAQFVRMALGSLQEISDQMIDARERGYITDSEFTEAEVMIRRAVAASTGLERYLTN
jgi:four helix bundle protein